MTKDDLLEQLREQGIDDIHLVKRCCLEGDGRLSVVRADDKEPSSRNEKKQV